MKQFMSVSEYSRHAGISRKTLHKHLSTGLLIKEYGKIDAEKADEILAVLHGEKKPIPEGNDYLSQKRQAEARYRDAKAAMAELDLSIRRNEYIEIEKVRDELNFLFYAIKQRLLSWSRSLPPKLAFKDERGCMKVLEDETYFVLTELSQGTKSLAKYVKGYKATKKKAAKRKLRQRFYFQGGPNFFLTMPDSLLHLQVLTSKCCWQLKITG